MWFHPKTSMKGLKFITLLTHVELCDLGSSSLYVFIYTSDFPFPFTLSLLALFLCCLLWNYPQLPFWLLLKHNRCSESGMCFTECWNCLFTLTCFVLFSIFPTRHPIFCHESEAGGDAYGLCFYQIQDGRCSAAMVAVEWGLIWLLPCAGYKTSHVSCILVAGRDDLHNWNKDLYLPLTYQSGWLLQN